MEARRCERQRRESAKSSAVTTLPSTQDHEFNLRLIALYGSHACLWNTTLSDYENAELKRTAWQDISSQLGTHLTPSFVRSRISSLRYRLNVYKLQMIEYKMCPAKGKLPEKLYYIDKFAFLDSISNQPVQEEPNASTDGETSMASRKSNYSIASTFRQRVQRQQQLEQLNQLPQVLQRLSNHQLRKETLMRNLEDVRDMNNTIKQHLQLQNAQPIKRSNFTFPDSLQVARRMVQQSQQQRRQEQQQQQEQQEREQKAGNTVKETPPKKPDNKLRDVDSMLKQRMHRLNQVEQGKESALASMDSFADIRGERMNIPSVVKKRIRQQMPFGINRAMMLEKGHYSSYGQSPDMKSSVNRSTLRALPGESVSTTKMINNMGPSKSLDSDATSHHSDDEDLYRLHWKIRSEQRARRPSSGGPIQHDLHPQPLPALMLGPQITPSSQMESSNDVNT